MKKTILIFAAILIMVGLTTKTFSQTNTVSNASASSKIVETLVLTETTQLNFGTMSRPVGAVNVVVSTTGVRSTSGAGTITLLTQAPTAQNAEFHVVGSPTSTYEILLPNDGVVTISNGTDDIHVNGFNALTSMGAGINGTLNSSGLDDFKVGATLVLIDNQAPGSYVGSYEVTVNYN